MNLRAGWHRHVHASWQRGVAALLICASAWVGAAAQAQDDPRPEGIPADVAPQRPLTSGTGWTHYLYGSTEDAQPDPAPTRPSVMLMGGGWDVGRALRWMIQQAGGGNFVVLRAYGTGAYDHYIYKFGGVSSVETLVVTSREGAADPYVLDRVSKAEAVFLAGGDQQAYMSWWKDTPLNTVLNQRVAAHMPIGGTSAGLAVLGQTVFSAVYGTIDSTLALTHPYAQRASLEDGMFDIPALHGVITDSHFAPRDRMGRLVSFLARNIQDGRVSLRDARAIGVDEQTALLVKDGWATVLRNKNSTGSVYMLRATQAPAVCVRGEPLTLRGVSVQRLAPGSIFNMNKWRGARTVNYELNVEAGVLSSTQADGSAY